MAPGARWRMPAGPTGDPLDSLVQGVSDPLMDYCAPASQEGDPPQGQWAHYVLRSSFGGSDSTFVVQGSEDGQVYLWHRDSGELLLKLSGHEGTVNSVAWNTANPYMMASASDDHTVRVWLAEAAAAPTARQHPHHHHHSMGAFAGAV
ncbi:MAG: hypothetical protein WDW36_006790 [Sanguina aurantia]